MHAVITVKNLVKRYGSFSAVKGISFEVKKGEIFGLLGENGAGKTTTLEMIEGLRKPSGGEIYVLEHDAVANPAAAKMKIGVQLQSSAYYNYLTLKEILELFASFYGVSVDPIELLDMVNLKEKANSFVSKLSGGQKQRFSIVASLVNDPEVVFLDEPTTGLDPKSRRNLWQIIQKIKDRGKTVVLTTHYLEEAEFLCDQVAIMSGGEIIAQDTVHNLIGMAKYPYSIEFGHLGKNLEAAALQAKLAKYGELSVDSPVKGSYELKIADQQDVSKVLSLVSEMQPNELSVHRTSLEDVFIELTGKTIADDSGEEAND